MSCEKIRKLIDRADRADTLPYEAVRHIDLCEACENFANGRNRLRDLLASAGRVTAPANFDATLRVRLLERSSERRLAWLGPSLYLRFGGATIALACALLIGQQLIRNHTTAPPLVRSTVADDGRDVSPTFQPDSKGTVVVPEGMAEEASVTPGAERPRGYGPVRYKGGGAVSHNAVAISAQADPGASAAAVLLMRGPSAESEVIVPAVSLGAQPIFYTYTEPRPSHIVRTRF